MTWDPNLQGMVAEERQKEYRHEVEARRQIKALAPLPSRTRTVRRAAGHALIRAGGWVAGSANEPRRPGGTLTLAR